MRALVLSILVLASCDRVFGLERAPDAPDAPLPPSSWSAVAGGDLHTCGIHVDGTLWCWGRNDHGQLGAQLTGADREVDEPRQVGTDANWVKITAGVTTTCAIKDDQTLWCWGDNSDGQVGINSADADVVVPTQVPGTWSSVSMGEVHACGIRTDQSLACWGSNIQGELGDNTITDHAAPVALLPGTTWEAIAVAGQSSCGLKTDHTGWCWGLDNHGQVTVAGGGAVHVPTAIGPTLWKAITVGAEFACGVQMDGKARCWGRNELGQLGDGTGGPDQSTPVMVGQDLISDWTDVHAGAEHACGLHGDGQLACWGTNAHGELVLDLATGLQTSPSTIAGTWKLAAPATHTTCAIDREGRLSCAGYGPAGGLGDGTGTRLTLTQAPGTWTHVAAGDNATCGLQGTQLSCWGANGSGTLGDGTRTDRQTAVLVAGAYKAVAMFAQVCAITSTNGLACWGANSYGQVGIGNQSDRLTPMTIGTAAWSLLSTGRLNTCGIAQGVQGWCWGYNHYSELDRGIDMPVFGVIPLQAALTWNSIASGGYHTCGVDPNHAVECWGYGYDGALGTAQQLPTDQMQLVPVPGNPMFDSVSAGERFTCAHTLTNQLWCWGFNGSGQLGDLTTVARYAPKQVPGDWLVISTGQHHMCGVQTDHSLWCWGENSFGQVGDGTLVDQHKPTRVGMGTHWAEVSAGDAHTCARTDTGELWCWGGNVSGALGDGTAWRGTFVEVTK